MVIIVMHLSRVVGKFLFNDICLHGDYTLSCLWLLVCFTTCTQVRVELNTNLVIVLKLHFLQIL
jgi:hypothetical protein